MDWLLIFPSWHLLSGDRDVLAKFRGRREAPGLNLNPMQVGKDVKSNSEGGEVCAPHEHDGGKTGRG